MQADNDDVDIPEDTEIDTESEGGQPTGNGDNEDDSEVRSQHGNQAFSMEDQDELPVAEYNDEKPAVCALLKPY